MSATTLLTVQLCLAVWMACVGWLVSVLVYPAFRSVDPEGWTGQHARHSSRITPLVAPVMLAQLVAAGWLLVAPPDGDAGPLALRIAVAVLVLATWLLTAFVSVRHHAHLARGWSDAVGASLLRIHHVRTALWSALVVLAAVQLAGA